MCKCVYIYIYRERERDTEKRERERESEPARPEQLEEVLAKLRAWREAGLRVHMIPLL